MRFFLPHISIFLLFSITFVSINFVFLGIFSHSLGNNLDTFMKRFLTTTLLIAVIAGVLTHFMPRNFQTYLSEFDDSATVSIYCRQTSLDCIDMGTGYKVSCKADDFVATASACHDVDGISVSFNGSRDDALALLQFFRLNVISEFEQNDLYVICGKSPKISGGVTLDGNLVNLQIAYKDGVIHLGSPLILGDY